MNDAQTEAIATADAHAHNTGLPEYSALLALVNRLAQPDADELLGLEDYRSIARNLTQPKAFGAESLVA